MYFLQRNKSKEICTQPVWLQNTTNADISWENVSSKRSFRIHQIYSSPFTMWLKITKIHYSDSISMIFIIRVMGPTIRVPGLRSCVLGPGSQVLDPNESVRSLVPLFGCFKTNFNSWLPVLLEICVSHSCLLTRMCNHKFWN